MEMDRVVSAMWWSNERLAGLPPAGRLAWLWMASCADRDGLLCVDKERLARSVGLKPPATADSALMLLSAFDVCLLYADDMAWLCDFPGTQPDRGAYRVEANFDLASPSPSDVREIVSNRIGRIATEKECKDICPRAYGLKREPRSQAYDTRVQEVWIAWRDRQQRPGACRFTPSTQRIIRGAMREAPAADLIALIDYAYESAEAPARFWRGENKDSRTYLGLDNLFVAKKLQGRLQLVYQWKARKSGSVKGQEVDLGPLARRGT